MELNTLLFAKTLARKDIASSVTVTPQANGNGRTEDSVPAEGGTDLGSEGGEFSSKAQIMTLMTTDVDRVSSVAMQLFSIIGTRALYSSTVVLMRNDVVGHTDSPSEIVVATVFLYKLLGTSAFVGLAVTCLFLPVNHIASKVVMGAQNNLMKARDERVSLMNEVRHSFPFSWLRDLRCICGVEGPGCHKNVEGALVGSLVTA